ncbi:hypothetical protein WJX84_012153 [Apatococcus fuscideae]|uniref:Membrane transporter protein n=1 Tax=Apatococcus fuscideae TaxID=2026836 RepID=A0AAW1RWS7_9CHLO
MDDRVKLHLQLLSFAVTGGLIGGVINALVAPLFGELHILSLFGVSLTPELTKAGVYHNGFWGALWGLALMVPWHKYLSPWTLRAFVIGLLPAAVQLFAHLPLGRHEHWRSQSGRLHAALCHPLQHRLLELPAYAWFTATDHTAGLDSEGQPRVDGSVVFGKREQLQSPRYGRKRQTCDYAQKLKLPGGSSDSRCMELPASARPWHLGLHAHS